MGKIGVVLMNVEKIMDMLFAFALVADQLTLSGGVEAGE